mmetsp:Transcript_75656/g.177609  ORF Transcript_75656/g.177609 Transcript_75656/m.177609 type:complete len:195 (-) Transcript_75656:112-696(-)
MQRVSNVMMQPTMLAQAACKGDLSKVQELLKSRADPNEQADCPSGYGTMGRTALHALCYAPSDPTGDAIAECLLEAKADYQLTDQYGQTPLHCCMPTHLSVARILLEHGADLNVPCTRNRDTPVHFAFKQFKEFNTPLLELLISFGADFTARSRLGRTPIEEIRDVTFRAEVEAELTQLQDRGLTKAASRMSKS